METFLDFTVTVIDLLAWPAVFVTLIAILREPISKVLPFLEKLKYKGFEVKFRERIEDTLGQIESTTGETSSGEVELTGSPTESVINAWSKIVEAAKKKHEQLEPNQKLKNFGPEHALEYFIYMGLLTPESKKILFELEYLKLQAAHYSNEVVSEESAKIYIRAVETVRKQIEAINNISPLKLGYLTQLLLNLHAAIDTGKYNHISIDDVHKEIENGNILRYVKKEAGEDVDLSLLLDRSNDLDFEHHYVRHLQSTFNAYAGDECRKWGIENSGLCLLAAWTVEIIQKGSGWQSNENIA